MPDKPSSNVKIYDRPERKKLSPLLLVVALIVVLVIGFFLYKAFYHPAVKVNAQTGQLRFLGEGSIADKYLTLNKQIDTCQKESTFKLPQELAAFRNEIFVEKRGLLI